MSGNAAYRYGPYAEYVEVKTPYGEWGIPAGQVLTFDAENIPVFTDAANAKVGKPVDPYLQADAHGNPLPPVVGEPEDEPEPELADPGF